MVLLHLSDLGPPSCSAPGSSNNQDKTAYLPMKKRLLHPNSSNELKKTKKQEQTISNTEAVSSPPENSCFVALVTPSNLHKDALDLPKDFTSSNGFKRTFHEIVITDEGKRSWALDLRFNKSSETFYISQGWRNFCDENGKKAGGFFMFELAKIEEKPLLSFCLTESNNDGTQGVKKQNTELMRRKCQRHRNSTSSSQNRFVTLIVTYDSITTSRLHIPLSFTRENGLDKPGIITLLGKDGTKWLANLERSRTGRMTLGKGWKDFAKANGLKMGESFILESTGEEATPMLSLFSTDSSSDTRQQGEYCLKASEKESVSTEPSHGNKTKKARTDREKSQSRELGENMCLPNREHSSSPIQNQLVKLTLEDEDVRAGKVHLPSQFMKANGINKLGKITIWDENKMEWFGYLLSKDGTVALGTGWKDFCEGNGVKTGDSFTLEFIHEQDKTPVVKLCSINRG